MDNQYDQAVTDLPFEDRIKMFGERSKDGQVSPAGAEDEMQTMPDTQKNPGYGVKPAQNDSPEEKNRVGRDYAKALVGNYDGNEALAAAAYNAGPGRVNKWIKEFGDPRTGEISVEDFIKKIPVDETRNYVKRVGYKVSKTSNPYDNLKSDNPYDNITETVAQNNNPYDAAVQAPAQHSDEGLDPDHTILGDINNRIEGTGRQLGSMLLSPATFVGGVAKGVGSELAGASADEAEKNRQNFQGNVSQAIQGNYPTNPALDFAGDMLNKGVDATIQGYKKYILNVPETGQPLPGEGIAHDALANIVGMKGAKDAASNIIEGTSRRIPDEGNALPNPDKPNPGVQETLNNILEQRNFEKAKTQEMLDTFNENPKSYGVDESSARNPYDVAGTVTDPKMLSFDPKDGYSSLVDSHDDAVFESDMSKDQPFSDRHSKMVELGNNLIKDIQEQGLSPRQVSEEFWNRTYPTLPEEVQGRFQRLLQRVSNAEPGVDVEDAARSVRLTSDPQDLERMNRWYVALMHEANNYPWDEKGRVYLENKVDAQKLPDDPNADKTPTKFERIFPTDDQQVLEGYFAAVHTAKNGNTLAPILDYIEKNSSDPLQRVLARSLNSPLHDPELAVEDKESSAYGTTYYNPIRSKIKLFTDTENQDLKGISAEVVLHEALHNYLHKALELGRDSRTREAYPEFARFSDDIGNMWVDILKSLPEEEKKVWKVVFHGKVEQQGSPGHELISWGLTNPGFQKLLSGIFLDKQGKVLTTDQTLWNQFYHAASKASNITPKDLIDEEWIRLEKHFDGWLQTFALTHTSAFQELQHLVVPILDHIKVTPFDPKDLMVVMDATKGWIDRTFRESMQDVVSNMLQTDMEKPKSTENMPAETKKILDKLVSPFNTYDQMYGAMGNDLYYNFKDLNRLTGVFYPVSTVKNIAHNPLVTFAFTKVRDIYGDAHQLQKAFVDSIKEFEQLPMAQKNKITVALNTINRPEVQAQLLAARGMDPSGKQSGPIPQQYDPSHPFRLTSDEAAHYGLDNFDVYQRTLQVLFEVTERLNKWAIKKGFGRDFNSHVVGYYPRSFGYGKYITQGLDMNTGALRYYRRSPTFKEAAKLENDLKTAGYDVTRELSKDFGDFKGHMMGLIETDPTSPLSQIAEKAIAASEEYKRTQEFERAAHGVAGFIGQNMNNPREVQLLNQLAYHHIQMSVEAYKAARLLTEVLRPMQEDVLAKIYYPNAVHWVADIVRRELGGSLSELKMIDRWVQWTLSAAHRTYIKRFSKYADNLKPNEQTLSPTAHRETARYVTATSSAYALVGNIPNILQNAYTIPLVSLMGGLPDAIMLGKNPVIAVHAATLAHTQSMLDFARILQGDRDPEVWEFIKRANDRGLVQANMFADVPQMRAEIEKGAVQKGFDVALNAPRRFFNDPVEVATNYMSLLFYNRFMKNLFPEMAKSKQEAHAIDLTKRYTGDYARYNRALMFDKLGVIGQGASNFSIWAGTRVAQGYELTKNVVMHKQIMPLVALMAAGTLVAGLEGMPGANDYENFRQWGQKHDLFDLPPADLVLKQNKVPKWLRTGVMLNMFGFDLSTRGRYSGFTDLGGVTYVMPEKAYDIFKFVQSYLYGKAGIGSPVGPTVKTEGNFVSAMPAALTGYARQQLMTRDFRGDGQTSVLSSHGSAVYNQDPNDKALGLPAKDYNLINLKTVKQEEQTKDFYNKLYEENKYKKDTKALKQTAIENLLKYANETKKGNKAEADRYGKLARENLLKYEKLNPSNLQSLRQDILSGVGRESDTAEESTLKELVKSRSAGEIIMLLNSLKTMNSKNRPSP
jgi:hypothetical protein